MSKWEHFLKMLFFETFFDISNMIFNYNQTIDKISHWNLKPITINITINITIQILQTGFHVKEKH